MSNHTFVRFPTVVSNDNSVEKILASFSNFIIRSKASRCNSIKSYGTSRRKALQLSFLRRGTEKNSISKLYYIIC